MKRWRRWLNTLGITGVVLKYRVPRRPGEPERLPAPGPLLDAQRAISLVRSRAREWGIDPDADRRSWDSRPADIWR